jgi:SPP1 gp7 family putative phage head morphogenesis protein
MAEDGAFGANRARTIAITETTNAHAVGNVEAWKAAGFWGHEWQTANDDLVCAICGPNHGKVRKFGNPFPSGHLAPAAHPRCRCGTNPVVDEEPEN